MTPGAFLSKNLIAILGMLATLATGYFAGLTRAAENEATVARQGVEIADLKAFKRAAEKSFACQKLLNYQTRVDPKAPPLCDLEAQS